MHMRSRRGFSLLEVITVLIIIGILMAIVAYRTNDSSYRLNSQAGVVTGHIRYAQTQAMNANPSAGLNVWGIKCDGTRYWLFRGTNPYDVNNIFPLFDDPKYEEANHKLVLSSKGISMSSFTVFFDDRGIPYSAYTDATTNTPLSAPLAITITPDGSASPSRTISIIPETGFVQ
ncbi:MAG: type II secretion system protein [Deltaproteobacteria bacterium]|nr:type II secretion system protein [Deltaproteobacteria bacterium]